MADNEFGRLLTGYRTERGLSCNELARAIRCDPSYISRLERADRDPPRRRVVADIAAALTLDAVDTDTLLVAAGFAPAFVTALGCWDMTLQSVAAVLTDPAVGPEDRQAFRTVVETLAAEWQARRAHRRWQAS